MRFLFLAEDLEKQKEGSSCWVNDLCFYVRRFGTKESKLEIEDIKEKLYGLFPNPKEVNEDEIIAHWLAEYGVSGWSGVMKAQSKKQELKFSRANARRIFLNEEYWLSLNKALILHANNFENYLHNQAYEEIDELKKP